MHQRRQLPCKFSLAVDTVLLLIYNCTSTLILSNKYTLIQQSASLWWVHNLWLIRLLRLDEQTLKIFSSSLCACSCIL